MRNLIFRLGNYGNDNVPKKHLENQNIHKETYVL